MTYLDGRMRAAEMFDAGWSVKDMLHFAQIAVEHRKSDMMSLGFLDAVVERC